MSSNTLVSSRAWAASPVEDLAPHHLDAVDLGQLLPRMPGEIQRVLDQLLATLCELPPRRIDARQDW
jgi:hypothetical protein